MKGVQMKKVIAKIKSLNLGTIVRSILQLAIYINQVVVIFGQSPLGNSTVYLWVSFVLTLIITGASYWYNNDWTKMAQTSGDILDMLRDGKITEDELKAFIKKHDKDKESVIPKG